MKKYILLLIICFFSAHMYAQIIIANPENDEYQGGQLRLMNSNENYNLWDIDNYAGNLRFFHSGKVFFNLYPDGKISLVDALVKIGKATDTDNYSPGVVYSYSDDFLYDGQYINHYGFGFHGYQDSSTNYAEPTNSYVSGYFGIDFFTGGTNRMRISRDGIVSIGTPNRQEGYKLAVDGKVKAKEIKVETGWSDFVFEKDYHLPTLEEVEQHIKQKGHLKDIPSAAQVEENGIFLGEMDAKLLQKIEELTLYTIEQEKRIKKLEENNKKLLKLVEKLSK
ncbi:hypothetical protein [Abyssalbus ytuae]|uniref:Uncharacterized protein n=1 Tax=Abyssalbus ytuae TaxID=2926907 RepID=A0A9E6ZP15_9FLAO|nr:hypothetical protein [Abyssalbus ytuae]UOB17895.1 hypothetical protein MQE35_01030 [Abyssalbus ytuae]